VRNVSFDCKDTCDWRECAAVATWLERNHQNVEPMLSSSTLTDGRLLYPKIDARHSWGSCAQLRRWSGWDGVIFFFTPAHNIPLKMNTPIYRLEYPPLVVPANTPYSLTGLFHPSPENGRQSYGVVKVRYGTQLLLLALGHARLGHK